MDGGSVGPRSRYIHCKQKLAAVLDTNRGWIAAYVNHHRKVLVDKQYFTLKTVSQVLRTAGGRRISNLGEHFARADDVFAGGWDVLRCQGQPRKVNLTATKYGKEDHC